MPTISKTITGAFLGCSLAVADGLASATFAQAPDPNPPQAAAPASAPAAADPLYLRPATERDDSTSETADANYDAQRLRFWNSTEMLAAREWILEYGRRSAQFKPRDAEQYLARLSKLSASQMKDWLEKFNLRQAAIARSQEVGRAARQTAVDEAVGRLQAVQRSYENFNAAQTYGALLSRDQLDSQRHFAGQMSAVRQADRDATLAKLSLPTYDWIINPPYWAQMMAAASLPGDLPPGDPNNFIRGDVPGPEVAAAAAAASAAAGGAGAAGAAGAGGGAGAGP